MMNKLMLACALIVLPCCMHDPTLDDAISEITATLDPYTADCIRECSSVAELCLNKANSSCIDTCESDCYRNSKSQYLDCRQACYDTAEKCLTVDADCVTQCVEEQLL